MSRKRKRRPPLDVEAQHEAALRAFVLRARRVKEHSLARDGKALEDLQSPTWKGTVGRGEEETTLSTELPPEEVMESAAARIRPIILKTEPTHYDKAMNALLYFANKAGAPPAAINDLRRIKSEWGKTEPHREDMNFYRVAVRSGSEPEVAISDHVLAYAWIYGDVVHADAERRERSRIFGVQSRFEAAVPVIARYMLLSLQTLAIVQMMTKNGSLPGLTDVMEEAVVAEHHITKKVRLMMSDYDPSTFDPDEPLFGELGEEWKNAEEMLFEHLDRQASVDEKKADASD